MEQQINPYETGQAMQGGYIDGGSSLPVTPGAIDALIATKFWVSLVGIVMLILTGLSLLSMVSEQDGDTWSVIIMLIWTALQVMLAVRLIQYGTAIGRLRRFRTSEDFEQAMILQNKFWVLLSVLSILMLVLIIIMWIGMFFLFRNF